MDRLTYLVIFFFSLSLSSCCSGNKNCHRTIVLYGNDSSQISRAEIPDTTRIKVYIEYDDHIDHYSLFGKFYPFGDKSETGQIEIVFTPDNGGQSLTFSNVGLYEEGHPEWPQKFTGKNIYQYVFNDKFDSFHDGDTLHWHYHTVQPEWIDSPLLYNAEFQFYDVDFDGKDEFLVNDYSQSKYGNHYSVYEITPNGFVLKKGTPFETITNLTKFYPSERKIVDYLYDDTEALYTYIISADGNRMIDSAKAD